jgi:hypothetical protein
LTPQFWAFALATLLIANGLAVIIPVWLRWLGGPYRPVTAPPPDYVEPRHLSIGADPKPPPASGPQHKPLHQLVILLAVNSVVVSALALSVLARYLEDLRRYRLVLPIGFDERRLKPRHRRPPGLELGSLPGGSRFRRFGIEPEEDDLET